MKKNVLITGGSGFIGFHLAKMLANEDYEVTIIDNFSRSENDHEFQALIEMPNVNFVEGNVMDPQVFENLKSEFDYIYHLAAINGTENFYKKPDLVLKVGILGILNILEWFVKQKKGKLLFSSSSEVYAGTYNVLGSAFPIPTPEKVPLIVEDPENLRWSYGGSKIISEILIHSYSKVFNNNNLVIVRYHNIYGPRMGFDHVIPQFIRRLRECKSSFDIFGSDESRTFCYVSDAVKATKLIMESPNTNSRTFNIGRQDCEIKIKDLAKKLFSISGQNPLIINKSSLAGSVARRCPDVSKLKMLGFLPTVDLDDGLKQTYKWYKDKI